MIGLSQSENYPLPDNAFSVVFFIFYNYVFALQLVTAVFMFCGHLPQRSRFGARVAAYIAVLFAVSSVWYSGLQYPAWLTIIRYFVIFGLATGGIVFMYKSTVLQAILCGTGHQSRLLLAAGRRVSIRSRGARLLTAASVRVCL